jgi:hypothetical protein
MGKDHVMLAGVHFLSFLFIFGGGKGLGVVVVVVLGIEPRT